MSDEEDNGRAKRVRLDSDATAALGAESNKCPYLNTVTRAQLDFDMSKVCSTSLTKHNVYCCLVCGSFFQGRGSQTPCYTHSVQAGHFVFIHLQTAKTYCLPDGYEIVDSSLNDIKFCLQPSFSPSTIAALDSNKALSRDIHGVAYLPGFVGMNSVIPADCINPVLHALSHIQPLRDFFMQAHNYTGIKPLLLRFGELVRKLWSPGNFKSVVSPQELVHDMVTYSKKRLSLDASTECIDLWNWLVGELHSGLVEAAASSSSSSSSSSSVISDCLSGEVELCETRTKLGVVLSSSSKRVVFRHLSLTVPPPPLFRDSDGALIIPQLPIFDLLKKFDGQTFTEDTAPQGVLVRKTYKIRKLPQFLLINLDRRGRDKVLQTGEGDKNGTIVTFPAKNLEMRDYCFSAEGEGGARDDGPGAGGTKYDLAANICLRGSDASSDQVISLGSQVGPSTMATSGAATTSAAAASARGKYLVHLHHKATDQWYAIDDLTVTEILPHQIALSESHILLYRRQ